ncbi:MAG: phenylacetate--CoA ligase family protein [Planctomycetes bacterium]|nr:phenylacetate--CoA ligase family protein [Planctomycetota bacterium]
MFNRWLVCAYESLRHPRDARQIRGFMRELEAEERLDPEAYRAVQLRKLKAILRYAHENVPFYRERYDRAGVVVDDIRRLEDLAGIPVLTRGDIRDRGPELVAQSCPASDRFENHTGGSTGTPMTFWQDRATLNFGLAADRYVDAIWGLRLGDKTAILWGADRDIEDLPWKERLMMRIRRQTILNSFAMDDRRMEAYASFLRSWRPVYIRGYASSLDLFAAFLERRGGAGIAPRAIRSSAETLGDEKRTRIEGAFGCPVMNFYGSREVNSIAAECREHRSLHVLGTNRLIEIEPLGGDAGGVGRLLVTDMVNRAMPFIRYRNDDVGILGDGLCACGRSLPVLSKVVGRVSDFIVSPDGRYVHGEYFTHLFYGAEAVESFQVYQRSDRSIEIRIVKRSGAAEIPTAAMIGKVREKMGSALPIDIRFVDRIEPTPSGKHRFTISEVVAGLPQEERA